jgi:hypothetical protein
MATIRGLAVERGAVMAVSGSMAVFLLKYFLK